MRLGEKEKVRINGEDERQGTHTLRMTMNQMKKMNDTVRHLKITKI